MGKPNGGIAPELIAHLTAIAESLCQLDSAHTKRSQYVGDLICALSNAHCQHLHCMVCCDSSYLLSPHYRNEFAQFRNVQLSFDEKLAAVVAVGNEGAVRLYLSRDGDPLRRQANIFGNPIQAAASTGMAQCVKILL
jgi:hypothetical protein